MLLCSSKSVSIAGCFLSLIYIANAHQHHNDHAAKIQARASPSLSTSQSCYDPILCGTGGDPSPSSLSASSSSIAGTAAPHASVKTTTTPFKEASTGSSLGYKSRHTSSASMPFPNSTSLYDIITLMPTSFHTNNSFLRTPTTNLYYTNHTESLNRSCAIPSTSDRPPFANSTTLMITSSRPPFAKGTAIPNVSSPPPFSNETKTPRLGNGSASGIRSTHYHLSHTTKAKTTTSTQTQPSQSSESPSVPRVLNLKNSTCNDFTYLPGGEQWAAVDGDTVLQTFLSMYKNNSLICPQCFGQSVNQCNSNNDTCLQGLKDLAVWGDVTTPHFDNAIAKFAGDGSATDFDCSIGSGACTTTCNNCLGPGGWVLVKSIMSYQNYLQVYYNAIKQAGAFATDQMNLFSAIFAPVPKPKDDSMYMGIIFSVVGGLAGFAGSIEKAVAAGIAVGVASSVVNQVSAQRPGAPADTASILGVIANITAQAYVTLSQAVMQNGTYSYGNADGSQVSSIDLPQLMSGGSLMQDFVPTEPDLTPTFARILFQQLAVYTWRYAEVDKLQHVPFIAFAKQPCAAVDDSSHEMVTANLGGIKGYNSGLEIDGWCFWLVDGAPVYQQEGVGWGAQQQTSCGIKQLYGASNDTFSQNSVELSGLSLADFIVPSVSGWNLHDQRNGYGTASQNGGLVDNPQSPGAVDIPVCDYLGNPKQPGVGCPNLGEILAPDAIQCNVEPASAVPNLPGDFTPGWCSVHVIQYAKNIANNPLNDYQLEVTIHDGANRLIGTALKQSAASPLEITDTSLPFNLIVAAGDVDSSPIQFWYADQYWDSNSAPNKCSVGGYDSGDRQMDCGWTCPMVFPVEKPPVSATIGHKLPAAPTDAGNGGLTTFINTFHTSTHNAKPTLPPTPPKPTYATGTCRVHVKQFQLNEGAENPTFQYALVVTLYDGKNQPITQKGQIQAPKNIPIPVDGMVQTMFVTAGNANEYLDSTPLYFAYGTDHWNSNDKQCSVGGYDSGHRDMDCNFSC